MPERDARQREADEPDVRDDDAPSAADRAIEEQHEQEKTGQENPT